MAIDEVSPLEAAPLAWMLLGGPPHVLSNGLQQIQHSETVHDYLICSAFDALLQADSNSGIVYRACTANLKSHSYMKSFYCIDACSLSDGDIIKQAKRIDSDLILFAIHNTVMHSIVK